MGFTLVSLKVNKPQQREANSVIYYKVSETCDKILSRFIKLEMNQKFAQQILNTNLIEYDTKRMFCSKGVIITC